MVPVRSSPSLVGDMVDLISQGRDFLVFFATTFGYVWVIRLTFIFSTDVKCRIVYIRNCYGKITNLSSVQGAQTTVLLKRVINSHTCISRSYKDGEFFQTVAEFLKKYFKTTDLQSIYRMVNYQLSKKVNF